MVWAGMKEAGLNVNSASNSTHRDNDITAPQNSVHFPWAQVTPVCLERALLDTSNYGNVSLIPARYLCKETGIHFLFSQADYDFSSRTQEYCSFLANSSSSSCPGTGWAGGTLLDLGAELLHTSQGEPGGLSRGDPHPMLPDDCWIQQSS